MHAKDGIILELRRARPTAPHIEPVSGGVPFGRALLTDADAIDVFDRRGRSLPVQMTPLARWPDASVRWALFDLLVDADEETPQAVHLHIRRQAAREHVASSRIMLEVMEDALLVDTGAAQFCCPVQIFAPFALARPSRAAGWPTVRSRVVLEDAGGHTLLPRLQRFEIETRGPVRLNLAGTGEFLGPNGRPFCSFATRVSFFAGLSLVRLEFTVLNPRRAQHRGGIWDLGDPGSIFFRSLSVDVHPPSPSPCEVAWQTSREETEEQRSASHVEMFQASSGGENWSSRNHVDRTGRVPLPFRGCRVTVDDRITYVDRAAPVVSRIAAGVRATIAFPNFWQQFPSALEAGPSGLRAGLFPRQFGDVFELQGGEQKTHTVFLSVDATESRITDLGWVHDPLVLCVPPEHSSASGAFSYFVSAGDDPHREYVDLAQQAVDGPASFFCKREANDEYGWRHFGDTPADHEDVYFAGTHPVVSHYNNQYDLLYGFLLHFARTADPRWFALAADLARHVIDIDIYHTTEDKAAYNGGLFWHTDHYQDAGRATHRSYSADSPRAREGSSYGGGPSAQHNYTTGLLYFYYLSGDPSARRAVEQLAAWVVQMDDGRLSLLGHLDPGPTGLASHTGDITFHGPGRGAGNSINALVDAFELTLKRQYLAKAEELMQRCMHPADDVGQHNLLDLERRWSYVVCLQSLGKYLDLKCELGENDFAFAYAQACLNRYVAWMAAHEGPSMARFAAVDYPTESWPAQDVRKSCVFDYGAKYGPPDTCAQMTDKAEYFFRESIRGVLSFPTCACTRPLAVLLANGVQRASFRLHPPPPITPSGDTFDFGAPQHFQAQKALFRKQFTSARGYVKLMRAFLRPSAFARVLSGRIW